MPYQLHCCSQLALLTEELTTEDEDDEDDLDEGAIELGVDDLDEETAETDEGATEDAVPPEHTVPLTAGLSSAPPFLFSWKPKLTVWPGWIAPFQLRLEAV